MLPQTTLTYVYAYSITIAGITIYLVSEEVVDDVNFEKVPLVNLREETNTNPDARIIWITPTHTK